jgi:hypothetical protein
MVLAAVKSLFGVPLDHGLDPLNELSDGTSAHFFIRNLGRRLGLARNFGVFGEAPDSSVRSDP